ncbi:MAG: matrixin family metalloprotease [Burkholderiales bacterium]|nr:M10 family metallopeptidase [Nitrosomonas sp.]MCP5275619.1 matrixin family metalloprotease [Burkholderiales bacterium]
MPTPFSFSDISFVDFTDSNAIDPLILGSRWKNPVISYSFPDDEARWFADPLFGYGPGEEPWSASYSPISPSNKADFVTALGKWENVASIDFDFIDETSNSVGDIRIAYTEVPELDNAEAWAYLPTHGVWGGDIWINKSSSSATQEWVAGSFSFLTVLHEIGHAVGLTHPFEDPSFSIADNSISATIMSYSALPGDQNSFFDFYPTTPMPLDIKAIQHIYGANKTSNKGDNVHRFTDSETYHETIWDSDGIDTISYTGNQIALIQLEEGQGSFIGNPVYAINNHETVEVPNIWIAYDTVIENASGGRNDDTLMGNQYDNHLSGHEGNDLFIGFAGNDTFEGGSGIDHVLLSGDRKDYTLQKTKEEFLVTHQSGNNGQDKLIGIERLLFDNIGIAFDIDGDAGQIAKLAGIIFGASSVRNKDLIKIGLSLTDNGTDNEQLASAALNAAGAHNHDATVTLLWHNLFGIDPTSEEKQPYVDLLDNNSLTPEKMTLLAANTSINTDNIDLIGLSQNGIEFNL